MRLKVEVFFKVSVWDKRFLLSDTMVDWTKATVTNQGLDRVGDSYWIGGVHVGGGTSAFTESSNGLEAFFNYNSKPSKDTSSVSKDDEVITWVREMEYRFNKEDLGDRNISEVSLSWDRDPKTASALLNLPEGVGFTKDQELVVSCKVHVIEDLDDIEVGEVDFGASKHTYTIKPCFFEKFKNAYIGSPLTQKDGRVYSGEIPIDQAKEPTGSIDTNLAVFNNYTYETRSRTFSNFFTLSSPNAVTRTVTSHTYGLPSAFGVQFDPPIDKDFNRELTLNFKINWDRG